MRPTVPAVAARPTHPTAVALGLLLSLGLVVLHLEYHRHAGALWRDEITSVNVATLPTFADTLSQTHYDSFPVAWQPVLRLWIELGFGETDQGLRRLGLVIGLATIAVLWWVGYRLGVGPPLVTLLLFGMSPTTIVYGDEVRGYGLAALAIAWSMGAMWAFLEQQTPGRFAVAQIAAVAAAQTHYANCVLLAAVGLGAAAVAVRRGDRRLLVAVLALGGVAALSLLLDLRDLRYITTTAPLGSADWGLGFLLRVFVNAFAPGVPLLAGLWLLGTVLALVGFVVVWTPWTAGTAVDKDRGLHALVTIPVAVVVMFYALLRPGVPTNYWHYLSLLVVVAFTIEVGIWLLTCRSTLGQWSRIGGVAVGAVLVAGGVADTVPLRMTNVDVVARKLNELTRPDDLVVVFPWYCGLTFQRYYAGQAPWITIPDLDEHRVHTHLLIAERMKQGDAAVGAELARVERTLRSGGRVWVVGELMAPDATEPLPRLPPAPNGPKGWASAPYLDNWELQLGALLEARASKSAKVPLPDVGRVNAWEKMPLTVMEGWR